MAFHVKDGVYFERIEDGTVHLTVFEGPFQKQAKVKDIVMSPSEWASVVASVSHNGESAHTFKGAMLFHNGEREAA